MRRMIGILILLLFPIASSEAQLRKRGKKPTVSQSQILLKKERIEWFQSISEIHKAVVKGILYPIPAAGINYAVDPLPEERRFCRPYSLVFLQDFANEMIDSLSKKPILTSCIRDRKTQTRLRHTSSSAAPTRGKNKTAHYTGAAVDVSFRGVDIVNDTIVQLSRRERESVTRVLTRLQKKGLLVFKTEENKNHWHVVVSKKYQPPMENNAFFSPIEFYNSIFNHGPR